MNEPDVFRVVGVRADKSRFVVCQGLTKKQAMRVKDALEEDNVFQSIEIEPEDASSTGLDLRAGD